MTGERSTDGYGGLVRPFEMTDPKLPDGSHIIGRFRTEDGEHVWIVQDTTGRRYRWLEDEGGPEWSWRNSQVRWKNDRGSCR